MEMGGCPLCAQARARGDAFCERCGASLRQPKFCEHCGTPFPSAGRFCKGCGRALPNLEVARQPSSFQSGKIRLPAPAPPSYFPMEGADSSTSRPPSSNDRRDSASNTRKIKRPAPTPPPYPGNSGNSKQGFDTRIPDKPPRHTGTHTSASKRHTKGKPAFRAVMAAAILLVAVGGYWVYSRQAAGVPAAETPIAETPNSATQAVVSVQGDSSAVQAFNLSMLGLVAAAEDVVYTSESGVLKTIGGDQLLDYPFYYMNAGDDGVYGVDVWGRIGKVDRSGSVSVLREEGHPSLLFVYDGGICFVENGLWHMDKDGSDEILLVESPVSSSCLAFDGGWVYYIGESHRLFRISLDGGSPEQIIGLRVEQFCVDNGIVYFTIIGGNGSLWRVGESGNYTAVSNAMMETPAPSYVVSGETLYFGGENTPVYQCALGGNDVQVVSPESCGLFYILGDQLYPLATVPEEPSVVFSDSGSSR